MQADYKAFVDRMIGRYEGGYGWDRGDSGGPTKYGVTCYDLAQFEHQPMGSMSAWAPRVQAMSLATAEEIYVTKYATACDFNDLTAGADVVVFDFGVNSGPSRSVKCAQRIVGVTVDGVLGPATRTAINSHNPVGFVNALCDERIAFLRGLSIFGEFGRGWMSRVSDLRGYALNLISHPPQQGALQATFEPKLERILGAHIKAYGDEELKLLGSTS